MTNLTRALFLDRDGVVNLDYDYVHRVEDFVFQDGIFELCQLANAKGYLIFIITNQAGIGRGYYSERDFLILTKWMLSEFKKKNCNIRKVFFCPYHPEHAKGKYKRNSFFRKPNPGMILKAARRYSLDLSKSVLVGDQISDIDAGINAGINTNILILSQKNENQLSHSSFVSVGSLRESFPYFI
ncbi:D-glycero-alpha-D-manno-heptose-1,7-bisphosphate 7-phosphatase [Leptospira jelokensis]|uniref:D,D-heptose 1,7-bisphosphate phosphatase n=1 Tax=Leptospira jelokensis TaxID=2484931 RepID=A0A4Z1A4N8_9LEPT|nr:HAD family hydrolase [Leptospira jelokensis]TGL77319.1 HAD family hydrolase [Leptospira jelokensis]